MDQNLLDFHLKCQSEYNTLLNTFNILFYGYGNKENVLSLLFPSALKFNMRFCTIESIIEDIIKQIAFEKKVKTLKELDIILKLKKMSVFCIIFNFNLSFKEFQGLTAIKLIGTIENLNFEFTQQDLTDFNFIMRDLTTFEDYSEDIIDSEILNNKIQNVKLIIGNLSVKPRFVFQELLKKGNCTANLLFDCVKSILFLSKIASLMELLREFIDHKVIKVTGNNITINLNISERESILEYIKEEESKLLKK